MITMRRNNRVISDLTDPDGWTVENNPHPAPPHDRVYPNSDGSGWVVSTDPEYKQWTWQETYQYYVISNDGESEYGDGIKGTSRTIYIGKPSNMKYISANENEYFVAIENHNAFNHDYRIWIACNKETGNMFELVGSSQGKLYTTVLLKRLNTWFKKTFKRRAEFKWDDDSILS
jgi:hypothetical protein